MDASPEVFPSLECRALHCARAGPQRCLYRTPKTSMSEGQNVGLTMMGSKSAGRELRILLKADSRPKLL